MSQEQKISDAKTRIFLMLILITLLVSHGYLFATFFAVGWATVSFIRLTMMINSHLTK